MTLQSTLSLRQLFFPSKLSLAAVLQWAMSNTPWSLTSVPFFPNNSNMYIDYIPWEFFMQSSCVLKLLAYFTVTVRDCIMICPSLHRSIPVMLSCGLQSLFHFLQHWAITLALKETIAHASSLSKPSTKNDRSYVVSLNLNLAFSGVQLVNKVKVKSAYEPRDPSSQILFRFL